ncbi:MAG: nitroreductase [Paracoccaceae bacterium]
MTQQNPVLQFLLGRRSTPAKALRAPAPSDEALDVILRAAARVPDHGALAPWRFVVIEGAALARLSTLVQKRGTALGIDPEKVAKSAASWANAPKIVAVIAVHKPSDKAPEAEQFLSAGAACLSLVNAALATGWGAAWITGWAAFDRGFVEEAFGLAAQERIAGFIHLGTCESPVPDRTRPDMATIVQVLSE